MKCIDKYGNAMILILIGANVIRFSYVLVVNHPIIGIMVGCIGAMISGIGVGGFGKI